MTRRCMNCPRRHVGCHAECRDYADEKKALDADKRSRKLAEDTYMVEVERSQRVGRSRK